MSDLPNFKRNWARKFGYLRLFIMVATAVAVACACAFADDDMVQVSFDPGSRPEIGAPYTVDATLSNNGEKTATVDLQVVIVSASESPCAATGKHLLFSNPMKISVPPNRKITTTVHYDTLSLDCAMPINFKAFLNVTIDQNHRYSRTVTGDLVVNASKN